MFSLQATHVHKLEQELPVILDNLPWWLPGCLFYFCHEGLSNHLHSKRAVRQ